MSNLITTKQKKIVRTEYLIRVFVTAILFITLLGAFLLAYVIPYYISVSKKDLMVAEQFAPVINAENRENTGESLSRIVNRTLDQLMIVELYNKNTILPSDKFSQIILSTNPDIQINRLSYSILRKGSVQFSIGGVARNRAGLVKFVDDLKSKGGFPSVESPVSDLVKESNITFTINLKVTI